MWIGLQYKGSSQGWQWEDRSQVSYTKWKKGSPNATSSGSEDCVQFNKGGDWSDGTCQDSLPYFCKKIAETEYCAVAKDRLNKLHL